jgi:hypothetical protein
MIEFNDERLVCIAFLASEAMVEVSHDNRTRKADGDDGSCQGYAVRAARNGNDQAAGAVFQ